MQSNTHCSQSRTVVNHTVVKHTLSQCLLNDSALRVHLVPSRSLFSITCGRCILQGQTLPIFLKSVIVQGMECQQKKNWILLDYACHPCAGAMLYRSNFNRWLQYNQTYIPSLDKEGIPFDLIFAGEQSTF